MSIIFINIILRLFVLHQEGNLGLTASEVEFLLGKNAVFVDKSDQIYSNRKEHKWNYQAQPINPSQVEKVNLYYMYESYKNTDDAIADINRLMQANQKNGSYRSLNADGQVGFLKTDNQNYCIIILVKSNHMIRLKINKLGDVEQIKKMELVGRNLIKRM